MVLIFEKDNRKYTTKLDTVHKNWVVLVYMEFLTLVLDSGCCSVTPCLLLQNS